MIKNTIVSNTCVTTSKFKILPWQQNIWKQITNARHENRLHHAYLISGATGLGKLQFAHHLAQSLLCKAPANDGIPCNICKSCHLLHVGNHPDLKYVLPDPEKKSEEIGIDAIRNVAATDELAAHFGGYKVIIIAPADNLNRSAANSLLKTLEEPSASAILLLITSQPGRLLPTIRSRCQHLPFCIPNEADALAWLATQVKEQHNTLLALRLAHGAPLAALKFLEQDVLKNRHDAITAFFGLMKGNSNFTTVAEIWNNQDSSLLLTWLSGWIADLLRLQTNANNVRLENPDLIDMLKHYANNLNTVHLHNLWSKVIETRKQLRQTNVNPQLLIETVLIQWSEISL